MNILSPAAAFGVVVWILPGRAPVRAAGLRAERHDQPEWPDPGARIWEQPGSGEMQGEAVRPGNWRLDTASELRIHPRAVPSSAERSVVVLGVTSWDAVTHPCRPPTPGRRQRSRGMVLGVSGCYAPAGSAVQVQQRVRATGTDADGKPGKVQHESTATGTDLEGRGYTLGDGDLRGWTWVDVVPVVCKQGVRGSSPLSSTGWSSRFGGDHVHV
jgi:hypothetical protein